MFFAWDIVVPVNTPETAPTTQTLKLTAGVITGLDVKFPAGCNGLVKVRLFHRDFQLVPLSKGEWVTGNDEVVPTESYFSLASTPYTLKFVACSPSSDYEHTITVRATVLPQEMATFAPLVELLTKMLRGLGLLEE